MPGLSGRKELTSTAPLASTTHQLYHFILLSTPRAVYMEGIACIVVQNPRLGDRYLYFAQGHRANQRWRCDLDEGLLDSEVISSTFSVA